MSIYQERDAADLDEQGNHYIRHVCAMTREHLELKSQIAAELAYRDYLLARLAKAAQEGRLPTPELLAMVAETLK